MFYLSNIHARSTSNNYLVLRFLIINYFEYITFYRLTLLAEVEQKQNRRALCNKYTQLHWKNLPKSIRRLWVFLAVNQSYPSPLKSWTVEQIAQFV